MRNALTIFGVCLILTSLFSFLTNAQSYSSGDDQAGVVTSLDPEETIVVERKAMDAPAFESKEAKLERMLSAFDRGNYKPGILLVSFSEGTTKEEAASILRAEGFSIAINFICTRAEVSDDIAVDYAPECFEQGWNDNLKLAQVRVLEGQEKSMAQQLVTEEIVVWVEPEMINTLAQEQGNEPTGPQTATTLAENVASDGKQKLVILAVVGVIVLIGLIVYLMFRRRKSI